MRTTIYDAELSQHLQNELEWFGAYLREITDGAYLREITEFLEDPDSD